MIKRLQRKFVMITALSVAIVMIVLLAGINAANMIQTEQDSDTILRMLSDNDGRFPDNNKDSMKVKTGSPQQDSSQQDIPQDGLQQNSPQQNNPQDNMQQNSPQQGNPQQNDVWQKNGSRPGALASPEAKFRTRYFSVYIKNDGTCDINTDSIAAVSQDGARQMADSVLRGGRTDGYNGNYRFKVTVKDDGKLIVFLDCDESLRTMRNFALLSVIIGAVCLALVTILVMIFSRRAIKPVAQSIEKQKRFITDAGHEIKTPLAIISANAEVIEMMNGETEWTKSICNQVERLNVLVKGMLELSRMDEMSEKPQFVNVNLSETVRSSTDGFMAMMQKKNITCSTDIADNVCVMGDSGRLAELVSLLMDNAIKYCTESGSMSVKLWINGRKAVFSVYNSYDGELPDDMNKLFDRFYRTDESRSRSTGGYGIGLSVAQAIVQLHKGKISVEKKDGGACFTVTLVRA